jgi:hypothetical protein
VPSPTEVPHGVRAARPEGRRRTRRDCAGLVLALLAAGALVVGTLVAGAAGAAGHGAAGAAFSGRVGPYQVYAYDGQPGARPRTITYSMVISRAGTGRPVDGATVTIRGRSLADAGVDGHPVGPIAADRIANVYRYSLPDRAGDRWRVRATIQAAAGTAATQNFVVHPQLPTAVHQAAVAGQGAASGGLPLVTLGVGGAVLAIVVMAFVVSRPRPTVHTDEEQ